MFSPYIYTLYHIYIYISLSLYKTHPCTADFFLLPAGVKNAVETIVPAPLQEWMEETTEEAGGASTSSRTLTKSWDLRI